MGNITPFQFDNHSVRVITGDDGEPLFVGKDICDALGYKNASDAMNDHCRGVAKRYPIADSLGRMQETRVISEPDVMRLMTNSTMPEAEKFERLVFEEILPTIRKTGSYSTASKAASKPETKELPAPKVFTDYFRVARLIGLDKNVAAISANQATAKITGTNVLALLGQTHLDNQEQKIYLTPTEIGNKLGGISGRKVNMLLAEAGLQAKHRDKWLPLKPADGMFRVLDTGKAHADGSMVQQIKWVDDVLDLIHQPKELAKEL
jgi:prophage antirepressor-like protein